MFIDFLETHEDADNYRLQLGLPFAVEILVLRSGMLSFEDHGGLVGRGHTAGHALFRLRSGSHSLLHFMDVAHHHTLMFSDPSWAINFDHHPEQAVDTRKKIFVELSTTHERAYGFHLPFPGLGRVARVDRGYAWQQERWSWGI